MAAASAPIMLSWIFISPVIRKILIPSHWLLFHITIVGTMDSGKKVMNRVAMTISSPRKNIDRAGDRTSDPLFSSPVRYRVRYGARQICILENLRNKTRDGPGSGKCGPQVLTLIPM